MRSSAISGRKKLENDLADLLAQVALEVRAKEDSMKAYRKSQVCILLYCTPFNSCMHNGIFPAAAIDIYYNVV